MGANDENRPKRVRPKNKPYKRTKFNEKKFTNLNKSKEIPTGYSNFDDDLYDEEELTNNENGS